MRKYIVLLIGFIFTGYGQHTVQFQLPKTPEVFLFERYGNIPLNSYTGKPNISLPLHEIQYGDVHIELNLTYSSNGIRVEEESSNVGLGWYFGTGMISQNIQDKDDLKANRTLKLPQYLYSNTIGYPIFPNPHWSSETGNYYTNSYNNDSTTRVLRTESSPSLENYFITRLRSEGNFDNKIFYNTNMNDFKSALDIPYSNDDLSIDFFTATFFGHHLIFIIEGNQVRVLNNVGYKVEKEFVSEQYKWRIIDTRGITYFFDEENQTLNGSPGIYDNFSNTSITDDGTQYHTCLSSAENGIGGYANLNGNISRTWKITKIRDTKGNEIIFNYENLTTIASRSGSSGECNFINIDYTSNEPRNKGLFSGSYLSSNYDGPTYRLHDGAPYEFPVGQYMKRTFSSGQIRVQQKSILKEILYSNNKIIFNNTDRVDIPFDKKTSGIIVMHKDEVVKTVNLLYDYFNPNHSDNTQKRLKLLSLEVNDKTYLFEYHGGNLPNKNSNSFDYWGYYNGMPNTSSINNPFRLFQNSSSIPTWAKQFAVALDGKANRSAHPEYCKEGILESIIYPTGGRTSFVYELNEFDNYFFPNYDNKVGIDANNNFISDYTQNKSKGYGLRIKEVINIDTNNETLNRKKYTYTGGKHIPAYVGYNDIDTFKAVKNLSQNYSNTYNRYSYFGQKITSYHSSIYQVSALGNGDSVGYDTVTIEELDQQNQSNGKVLEHYSNVPDLNGRQKFSNGGAIGPYSSLSAFFCDSFGESVRNSILDNGLLLKKEIYNNSNNLQQTIDYTYDTKVYTSTQKYNVRKVTLPGSYGYFVGDYSSSIEVPYTEYLFFYYPLKFYKNLLSTEKLTEYYSSGSKWNLTTYSYDNNNIPIGKVVKNQFGNEFYAENSSMHYTPELASKNILTLPSWNSISENGAIKKYYKYLYQTINSVVLLSKVEELPESNPDPSKKINIFYDLYDDKSNLLQYHKENDVYTSIVWGYNKSLPVAKIENVQNSQIQQSLIQAIQNASDTGTEADLLTALTNLRNSMPNAMITTYTHIPLVGVSSITDPKGNKMTYYYDSYNRLEFVKDKDGNIINEYKYHFRPHN